MEKVTGKLSKWKLFSLLLVVVLLTWCGCASKKTVTITDEDTVTLKYDCSHFVSQVKSGRETNALIKRSNEVLKRANQEDNKALSRSIHAARDLHDILRLEELTVTDECAHLK
jgi:type IV pilus biogenesis protein CpaD/CtpE